MHSGMRPSIGVCLLPQPADLHMRGYSRDVMGIVETWKNEEELCEEGDGTVGAVGRRI